jgi:hypothetical protein
MRKTAGETPALLKAAETHAKWFRLPPPRFWREMQARWYKLSFVHVCPPNLFKTVFANVINREQTRAFAAPMILL